MPNDIFSKNYFGLDKNSQKIFKLENTSDAEAFGVTLEPAGGSKTPTLEKLYVLGKV